MKILHLCPLWYPIGRDAHGGIETLLATLIEALGRRDADSTVLATGDSDCAGTLVGVVERNLVDTMTDLQAADYEVYQQHQLGLALAMANDVDVVHSHVGPGAYALSTPGVLDIPVVHTHHSQVTDDLRWYARRHPELYVTAVSEFQAEELARAGTRKCTVVPNGIDPTTFDLQDGGEGLVFLGRIESEKGADIAIDVARATGLPLLLAGPITDEEFFDEAVRPRLNGQISYLGVATHDEKAALLGGSVCVLMPSRWKEPFGMVAIEAMACGTPVVALANGALPEVVDDGVTGFTATDQSDLVELVSRARLLDRGGVRERFEARFSIDAVAARYMDVYVDAIGRHSDGVT